MGWVPSRRPDQRPNQAAALASRAGENRTIRVRASRIAQPDFLFKIEAVAAKA